MADINAGMIKDLRERTGAGMSDCKKALTETDGDTEKAAEYLRKKGLAATEGAITSYIHNGRVGVLLEVNCETDFVARTDDFKMFVKDVAMHIAGASPVPLYVSEAEIDPIAIEKEREIRVEAARNPKDVCLLDQVWVRDSEGKKTIGALLTDLISKIGENVKIRRFVRWELGEGLEKKKDDFAAEVAKQAGL